MSLPNYLANIKSAGIYRFVWDKSIAPIQAADTLRLVVGYSEKGPFNTPVYIDNTADFKTIFGGISKKLEKKGVFFHRMALQALAGGPILALNLKKFETETVQALTTDPTETPTAYTKTPNVVDIYNTNRFWTLDPDILPGKIGSSEYFNLTATDSKETSCTIFLRKYMPSGYDVTVKSWYSSRKEEIPTYLEGCEDLLLNETFAEIYVFRGKFTPELAESAELAKYFDQAALPTTVTLNPTIKNAFGESVETLPALAEDECSNFVQVYRGTLIPYFKDNNNSYISLDLLFNLDNSKHKMLMKLDQDLLDSSTAKSDLLKTVNTVWSGLTPVYLEGYNNPSFTDINNVLSTLNTYKGLMEALTNNVDVEYHYIVDTFESSSGCMKTELATLAKQKDNCLAILNFPFMPKLVADSTYFDKNTNVFDITKIKGSIQLPSTTDGASWCAYYTSIMLGDGTVKTCCPSAAVVSNLFMEKYGLRQPYSIVAGPNYGLVTADGMIGPDHNFSRKELDFMEPFGVNCLVYVPRRGTQINSNQTAKQTPVSALSKVHVRELVIYLQDEIANMLQNYQWEFNTQQLRDTVKAKADKLLENVQQNGGVYAFENICDESNNTDDVINNEMMILSTHIEPGMGAGKLVEEITIHRKGGMSSSAV